MNAESKIRLQAREALKNAGWSKSVAVFFILFVTVLIVLFLQTVLVLGAELIATPITDAITELAKGYSFVDSEEINVSILSSLTNVGSIISYIVGFVLIFHIYCGVKRYFYLLATDKNPSVNEAFHYIFRDFKKCFLLGLRYGLLTVIKLLPCIAPAYIIFVIITANEFNALETALLTLSVYLTGIAGLAIWVLWTSKQFLSIYLFIENDSLPAGAYAKESERLLSGGLYRSVRQLIFSFKWWLLFALTGAGLIYFVPYFEAACATSAKWMIRLANSIPDKEVQE